MPVWPPVTAALLLLPLCAAKKKSSSSKDAPPPPSAPSAPHPPKSSTIGKAGSSSGKKETMAERILRRAAGKDHTKGPPGCKQAVPDKFHGDRVYEEAVRRLVREKHTKRYPATAKPLFVEIGGYLGQSTCYMARVLRPRSQPTKFKNVTFHTIGMWFGEDHLTSSSTLKQLITKHGGGSYKGAWDYFMDKTAATKRVKTVHHAKSEQDLARVAAQYREEAITFLYVDRRGNPEKIKDDLKAWWPKVATGGWICGRDYHGKKREGVDSFFPPRSGIKVRPWPGGNWCVGKKTQAGYIN